MTQDDQPQEDDTEQPPEWVSDLEQDLETRAATNGECEHGRAAYRDAARMVLEYWEAAA